MQAELEAKVERCVADAMPPRSRHVPSLDGLRCLAIVGVLALHCGVPGSMVGFLGVDLFFVLSGFLITTLLAREFRETGTIHLGAFWGRRFLRLMPAYWLYAGLICLAMFGFHWGWLRTQGSWTPLDLVASIFFYFNNYRAIGIWEHEELIGPLWSLSLEEQYYFTWPFLCLLLLRWRAVWVAWVLVAASAVDLFLIRDIYYLNGLNARGYGIFLGSATALTLDLAPWLRPGLSHPGFRKGAVAAVVVALAALTAASARGLVGEYEMVKYFMPFLCMGFALLIAMLWYGPNDAMARALSWGPMVYIGKISYGMYLYHMLAQYLVWDCLLAGIEDWPRVPKFGLRIVAFALITTGLASLSYFGFERRIIALKSRFR